MWVQQQQQKQEQQEQHQRARELVLALALPLWDSTSTQSILPPANSGLMEPVVIPAARQFSPAERPG
jgi:hypothetical protein